MRRPKRIGRPSNQLPLDFGADAPVPASREALFLAILPSQAARPRLVEAGRRLGYRYAWRGAVQPAARMHITLLGFGVDGTQLAAGVEIARRIGATVRRAPFSVVLEGAMSFGGEGHHAQVLRCSQGSEAALTGLYDGLRDVTDDLGVSRPGVRERFVPHLTVAYDPRAIPETALETPIGWMADRVVLIRSEQGLGRHTLVEDWALRPN